MRAVAVQDRSGLDGVVSGVGTGGTLVGLYEAFSAAGCSVTAFAARPVSGGGMGGAECCSFSTRVPGVVEGLSKLYENARFDELVEVDVPDQVAMQTARALIRRGFPEYEIEILIFCPTLAGALR